jgi:putative ABC transport system permease protein
VKGTLFLGWRYLVYHRFKTAVLLGAVTLMMFLPASTRLLVEDGAKALTARAAQTPLLVGAKGSQLELVLSSLYFHTDSPPEISNQVFKDVRATGLATAIPMHTRFKARDFPVVGTSLDYFEFRGLELAEGRQMGLLGECVIGAGVARKLGIGAGDSLVTSPETVFDLAGVYPLKMTVAGVFAPGGTPDDEAVFVDVRTSWVIQGLGHGHQDLAEAGANSAVLSRGEDAITANTSLVQYNEITPKNAREFHFHGDTAVFPLTAVIAVPPDEKMGTLLRGRYLDAESGEQLVVPGAVLDDLLETVFTVQNYVVLGLLMLSLATVAVIALVFLLSQQLRRGEFFTLRRMGASRSFIAVLVISEIVFVFAASLALAALMTWAVRSWASELLLSLMTL